MQMDLCDAELGPFFGEPGDPRCVVCGCSKGNACHDEEYGPCWWITVDDLVGTGLCSSCAETVGPWVVYTIGYEGRSLEEYMAALVRVRITRLVDVRENAISRRPGFSKLALRRACAAAGIYYEHRGELGVPSGDRRRLTGKRRRPELLDRYERTVLDHAALDVRAVRHLVESGDRLALTCFERDPEQCHRSRLARRIQAGAQADTITIEHL